MFTTTTKKTILFLVFCTAILSVTLFGALQAASNNQIPTEEEATAFVEDLITQGKEVANRPGNNQEEFGRLLEGNFVTTEISNFILGVHGRKFSSEQKERFRQLFAKRLVKMYSTVERVKTFRGTTHKIETARQQNDSTMQVYTSFSFNDKPGSEPVKVYWKVVKKDIKLYIFDILFEGISQLFALRSEYSSLFTGKGEGDPEKFLRYLRDIVKIEE